MFVPQEHVINNLRYLDCRGRNRLKLRKLSLPKRYARRKSRLLHRRTSGPSRNFDVAASMAAINERNKRSRKDKVRTDSGNSNSGAYTSEVFLRIFR